MEGVACADSAMLLQRRAREQQVLSLESMLWLYLLQNLYDLSNETAAAEAIDSRAFSDFCDIDSSNQIPDGEP